MALKNRLHKIYGCVCVCVGGVLCAHMYMCLLGKKTETSSILLYPSLWYSLKTGSVSFLLTCMAKPNILLSLLVPIWIHRKPHPSPGFTREWRIQMQVLMLIQRAL